MSYRRKRGHDDEEGAQGGGFRSKKRRTNEHMEIEDRLESLILRVGEKSTSSLESNLEGLASVLEAAAASSLIVQHSHQAKLFALI